MFRRRKCRGANVTRRKCRRHKCRRRKCHQAQVSRGANVGGASVEAQKGRRKCRIIHLSIFDLNKLNKALVSSCKESPPQETPSPEGPWHSLGPAHKYWDSTRGPWVGRNEHGSYQNDDRSGWCSQDCPQVPVNFIIFTNAFVFPDLSVKWHVTC